MASNAAVSGQSFFKKIRQSLFRNRTRTYIFPTGFGFSFAAMVLVLFVLAVGYANNLLYIFVFFLISVGWTGTLVTNRNVEKLSLEDFSLTPLFAEEEGRVVVAIGNVRKSSAWSVEAYFEKSNIRTVVDEIAPNSVEDFEVIYTPTSRGETRLPRLIFQSKFPFSLLRAWKIFKATPEVLVYPARKGDRSLPQISVSADEVNNIGLFREHRAFQNTDPVARVDWRASARRRELLVKAYEGADKQSLYFDWKQTEHLESVELRLSQLCLWIDEAERHGHRYALKVGRFESELGNGSDHHHLCLEVLALMPLGGPE